MNPEPTSVFAAHAPQAASIAKFFCFDLAICAAILLVVTGLVSWTVIRYRRRPGSPEPYQDLGNPKLETIWTVVPTLIVTVLFIGTAYTMHAVNPPVRERTPDVVVIAHQWWWEYRYPVSGVVTANELHLPAGHDLLLEICSADVIHDFWVPDLGAKVDAIPGHPNTLWLGPRQPGKFLGTCAEYCGNEHALMGIRVMVDTPEDFAIWAQAQLRPHRAPSGELAAQGADLFKHRTCQNCHTISGTAAKGKVGPDLSHVSSRETLGAGALMNSPENLAHWIGDPQRYKPGCAMPAQRLAGQQVDAIVAFLQEQP